MSFPINFYYNKSPTNFVTKDIQLVKTLTGNFRDVTSIIDPVITIQDSTTADIISKINYAYIAQTARYYFIQNITSIRTNLWEFRMHVDVLMTYKTQIESQTAIVQRQFKEKNMMLDDGWFSAYQNPHIRLQRFSNETPFEELNYILVVAGS